MYDLGLEKNQANFTQLTPITFIERAVLVNPEKTAIIYNDLRRNWKETFQRCRKLASALQKAGIQRGDTVSVMSPNTPAMVEAHFGVPMAGAVLNTLNVRLSSETLAFMLQHAETRVLLVDREFSDVISKALLQIEHPILIIDIDDPYYEGGEKIGKIEYEEFLNTGDENFQYLLPNDEWDAISLNYTSGTTGNPKGVVYHHRGAALNAISNIISAKSSSELVYLWTLPLFHCNGWCFPWTIAAVSGVNVCLRKVVAKDIYDNIRNHGVNIMCGAPIVLNTLINSNLEEKYLPQETINFFVAGASPPASIIEQIEQEGFFITHVYGLTETYGPSVQCEWKPEWNKLPAREKSRIKARQGVKSIFLDDLKVVDPETFEEIPWDGETMGEVMMRGNNVMRGYVKNHLATEEAFQHGWFHSGDLAVRHPDGYIEIRDRSKDIVISGGENVSTIEVEGVLYRIPEIEECACVAKPDEKWGETVCAFIKFKHGESISDDEIKARCREELAGFKIPKTIVVLDDLPKTSTGKIQKFELRAMARQL